MVGYKLENDSDFHVVLQGTSGASGETTMIIEFPDPVACAPRSYAPGLMQQAREAFLGLVPEQPTSSFRQLLAPIPVTVVGPLFLDKIHGQEGIALRSAGKTLLIGLPFATAASAGVQAELYLYDRVVTSTANDIYTVLSRSRAGW